MSAFIDGRHLRSARVMAGLTQDELARCARVHRNSVKYWERQDEDRLAGWAVERMAQALEDVGVVAGVTCDGTRRLAFVRRG